jgi:hypothetical protein
MKNETARTINDLDGTCVANCGNWAIHIYIREQSTGWSVHMTPYEAMLRKSQVSGYDNGPWPSDDRVEIPLLHVLSVMDYEGLSFEGALKTQYKDVKKVFVDEKIYDEVQAACNEAVKKVRRRIEDHLRKTNSRNIFKIARELEIEGQELQHRHLSTKAQTSRITFVSLPAGGEGYRTSVFADGRFMVDIPGHSCDPKTGKLNRHWSQVDDAMVLFRNKPLEDMDPDGYIEPNQFTIKYGEDPPRDWLFG